MKNHKIVNFFSSMNLLILLNEIPVEIEISLIEEISFESSIKVFNFIISAESLTSHLQQTSLFDTKKHPQRAHFLNSIIIPPIYKNILSDKEEKWNMFLKKF